MGLPVFFDSSCARFSLFQFQRVGEASEQARAVGGFYISPRRKRFSGAGNSRVGVVFGGWFEALHYLFGSGVDHI